MRRRKRDRHRNKEKFVLPFRISVAALLRARGVDVPALRVGMQKKVILAEVARRCRTA